MKDNFEDPIESSLMKRLQAGSYTEVPEKSENDVASNKLKLKGAAYQIQGLSAEDELTFLKRGSTVAIDKLVFDDPIEDSLK